MSYVEDKIAELRHQGLFVAEKVDAEAIKRVINMEEYEYYALETEMLEAYLGLLAQQIYYMQQECNMSAAREIEYGNIFKLEAMPHVIGAKIRSVEERWLFASTLTPELTASFNLWQEAVIDSALNDSLATPVEQKLQVLKKIYDDRRMDGRNKNNHKYVDGN